MNVRGKDKKVIAIVICLCFLFQIIFRSFTFDSIAAPSSTVIGLIFRDGNGYHIRNVSLFLNSDGTLTLPTPRDLGDTNDESYSNWSPVLVENSFENVKNVILNHGNIEIEDYDISRPPTLATSSVATPSIATSSNPRRGDLVIRNGFHTMTREESSNASITLYRSNVYYSIGSSVQIARANDLNAINNSMQQFVSKNGDRNQIFFLAVQPPVVDPPVDTRANTANTNETGTANNNNVVTVDTPTRTETRVRNNDSANSAPTPDRNTQSTNVVNNVSTGNTNSQSATVQVQDNVQTTNNQTNASVDTSNQQQRLFQPLGSGNSSSDGNSGNSVSTVNSVGGGNGSSTENVRPRVSINTDIVSNRVNGFLNTRTTSVSVEDNNFNANNYSVLVYKKVDGKEVLSNARYTWSSEGGSHRANIVFDDDGEYRIAVVKNNQGSGSGKVRFEEKVNVDATAPHITITGVEDLTANARTVSPVVKYSDVNIDLSRSKITLTAVADGKSRDLIYKAKKQDGGYVLNLDPIYIDDNYVLTVTIYDMAGNVTEKKVNFSVNKNGATFKFKPEELVGAYTNKPFTPSIEVWNTDEISIVSATINGMDEPYEFVGGELKFLNPINKDGKYVFNLEVSDTAGNKSSMKPVEVIYDATKPVCIINGVKEGESYEGSVNIILSTELPGDEISSVWLDDKLLASNEYKINNGKVELVADTKGSHTLKVQAKDKAGNLSDIETVNFEIKVPNVKLSSISLL
ncbi:MAG: Ig-like domain repeat protein, partial [Lachnoanaerobaculum sp.]|nr:Ig-like domain repeat protein [Lachnoanaerobaculum sp.]